MINQRVNFSEKNILNSNLYHEMSLKKLFCNLCRFIVEQPLYCHNCLRVACKKCCENQGFKYCPFGCKMTKTTDITDFYSQEFDHLRIQCPVCEKQFNYPELSNHICEIKKDRFKELEKFAKLNLNKEISRDSSKGLSNVEKVKCNFCSKDIILDDIEFHLKQECILSLADVSCDYCLSLFKEDEIKFHLEKCEVRIKNSCPMCKWFTKEKIDLDKHVYLCKNGLQKSNEILNISLKKNSPIKDLKKTESIPGLNLNPNHFTYINDPMNIQTKIKNLNSLMISYSKSFEHNFCKRCNVILKNKELVLCNKCSKLYCCSCCVVCMKCNIIADKNCLKSCVSCKIILCGECDKKFIFNCLCESLKICSNCIQFETSNLIHNCRYMQIIESLVHGIKCPFSNFKCNIHINPYKGNSIIIYFLDNIFVKLKEQEFPIKDNEIFQVTYKDKSASIETNNMIIFESRLEDLSYMIISFNKNFPFEKSLKLIQGLNFSSAKGTNTLINCYPIKEIKFSQI